MGLAAPRKRTKISHDPNNTNWARSTTNYGHKIMSRAGWQPGETLGVKDSAHSQHFSSASHTHIRVSRKDDTLGLGARARRPLEDNEPTGLDAFQGLLGRLNGKSEGELQKERRKVEDRRLMSYVERRWKTMYFVSGGFLVGDKKDEEEEEEGKSADKKEKVALTKAAEVDSEDDTSRSKRRSKDKKEKKESSKSSKKEKKHKKDRRKKDSDPSDSSTDESEYTTKEKSKSRKDKKKNKRKADDDEEATSSTKEAVPESKSSKSPEPSVAAPVPPRQLNLKGRHVLRGRYIQSKRMATLDDKSLNEIFMVKAKA